jgi:hypothetical protein
MTDVNTSGTFLNQIPMQLLNPRYVAGWLKKISHWVLHTLFEEIKGTLEISISMQQ